MGIILGILCVLAAVFFWFKALYTAFWRYGGPGERQARAEHARVVRENPDSSDAKISEAEYINTFFNSRPGFFRYFALALLVSIVGIPLSCAMQVSSM